MTATVEAPDTYLVADLFCGAGGSSTGARMAIEEIGGEMELVAVNHWNTAIATHSANHPTARHIVEDVSIVDPEDVVEGGRLDILMASPECRFHSRARGGKPIHDQGRMNPWAVHNWLTRLDVRTVLVENVPEFVKWGPLLPDGRPDRSRRGEHFQALGYQAEWRMLNAADYGDATTRVRFFLIARRDGRPIAWPEPTHARGDTGMFPGRRSWRGAREIIDWSNPGKSLLDHPKYIKKPLSPNTLARIARGLERFGGPLAPLYIRLLGLPQEDGDAHPRNKPTAKSDGGAFLLNRHGENGSDRVHPVKAPLPTATSRGAGYLVSPGAQPFHGSDRQHTTPRGADAPLHTITTLTGGGLYVASRASSPSLWRTALAVNAVVQPEAEPFIGANRNNNVPRGMDGPVPTVTTAHGGGSFLVEHGVQPFMLGQQSCGAPRSTKDPTPTITGAGAISLLQASGEPFLLSHQRGMPARGQEEPVPTITARGPGYLIRPTIIQYYGQSNAQEIELPLSTILTNNKHALIKPILVEYYTGSDVSDVDDPVPTITTKDRHGLASPTLLEVNHGNGKQGERGNDRRVHSVDDPLRTITTVHGMGLAIPLLVQTGQTGGNGGYSRPVDQPLPTLTTRNDINIATTLAEPYIVPNFGERLGQEPRVHDVNDPLPAVTSRGAGSLVTPEIAQAMLDQALEADIDPRRLVLLDGRPFLLDIRFRMLQNIELARAMGFSDDETPYEFVGNVTEVTKQIGNAVPVHLAAALVRAILEPE